MKKIMISVLLLTLILIGCSNQSVDIEGKAYDYKELTAKISEAQTELNMIQAELISGKAKYEEMETLSENKERLEENISVGLDELGNIIVEIETANKELDLLTGEIAKVKDEPIKLGAGFYYVGSDVPPGRYKLMAQEGNRGNVFVRGDGRSFVAETFGDGSNGSVVDFVFHAFDENEIEATIPVLLYPVE